MIKFKHLLNEASFSLYQGMVQVTFAQDANISDISEAIRALPGVTIVTQAGSNELNNSVVLRIKLLTLKSGENAFERFKQLAFAKIPDVKKVEIAYKTIERKK